MATRSLVTLLATVAVAATAGLAAFADGDPASDYLITQPMFLPFDAHIGKGSSSELAALLAAARNGGFEIRVAVIATPYDLGAVPVLYRKPAQYARFLGQELFYWYKHALLVVMPNGLAVYDHGAAPPADRATIAAVPPPGTTRGDALVAAGSRAVRALAARRGIDLSHVRVASQSSTGSDRVAIAIGAAVAVALAAGLMFVRRRMTGRR
jgi:hypothetical protein